MSKEVKASGNVKDDVKNDIEKIKRAIAILLVIFLISYVLLAARIIWVRQQLDRNSTTVVPDNIIGGGQLEHEAVKITLYEKRPGDNRPFHVENMLPGDSITQYYCIALRHERTLSLQFSLTGLTQTAALGEALQLKISVLGETEETVLAADSFHALAGKSLDVAVPETDKGESLIYYKMEVTLPTTAGNDTQGATLEVDFSWFAEGETLTDNSSGNSNFSGLWYRIWPWCIVPGLSLLLLIICIIILLYKRQEVKRNDTTQIDH